MRTIIAVCTLVTLFSCSPSQFVVPLNKKDHAVGVNLGGPLIEYSGSVIPVPFSSIIYGYGLQKRTTLFGALHTTSLAYGVIHTELGLTRELKYWEGSKVGLSFSPKINFMIDKWEWNYKLYPQIDLNAYWFFRGEPHRRCDCRGQFKGSAYLYAGLGNWFELSTKRYGDVAQQTNWVLMPQLGVNFGTDSWKYNFELKYMGFGVPNDNTVVTYFNPISDKGVMGVYFTVHKIIIAKK
jgi:hypothetical protein